jgi:trehalose 6-phosphate synthase/phosphatase
METRRLAVVSNRLPIVLKQDAHGAWDISPGSGGLVTALSPVLRDRGGLWIGWLGSTYQTVHGLEFVEDLLAKGAKETGYTLSPVDLTEEEVQKYYFGFSNEILWPLFHDLPTRCNFDPCYWEVWQNWGRKDTPASFFTSPFLRLMSF